VTDTAPADDRAVLNRLHRAQGQLNAVVAAAESGADCSDILTQLAAVSSALDRAGFLIISRAMKDCIEHPDEPGTPSVQQLEKLFLALA
jgi:DNA-binding FrmR family transcriptional regulator